MADEVNYGTARATDPGDTEELSKAELQRRMEEARESISQTVAEIKDTVVNQYQSVKDTVVETLDWREQYRKRPLAWSLGAMGAGLMFGYVVGGLLKGDSYGSYDRDDERLSAEDTRVFNLPPSQYEASSYSAPRSYAAQAVTGGAYGSSGYAGSVETEYDEARPAAKRADYSGGGSSSSSQTEQPQQPQEQEPEGPGLLERFKETKAYDRLQQEVSTLGDRLIEELSKTAQTVVLPALFGKVKDMFGVDLSGRGGQSHGGGGSIGGGYGARTASAGGGSTGVGGGAASQQSASDATLSGGGGGTTGGAGSTGGSSYATSDNRAYGNTGGGQGNS